MNGQRSTGTFLSLALLFCLATPTASAQNLTDDWVKLAAGPLVENETADGLSVGYIEGERFGIVHFGSAGPGRKKADYLTLYELGSITKVFTSLLLADAVVRGELKLDAPAEVPNAAGLRLPAYEGTPITWLDLSTHRSGLPKLPSNLLPADPKDPYRDYTSKHLAEFFKTYQLPRKAGESHEYSNLGVTVLAYLVAQKQGKSYQELLRERIAEPLEMTDCTVTLTADQRKRLATPHDELGDPTPPWTKADLPGSGGIHATMRDMMRFAKAQLNPPAGQLGEAIELAWKQQRAGDKSGPAMGLGWHIAGDGQTRWHNGETGGSHTALFVHRESKSAVVVLCNTAAGDEVDALAVRLLQKAAGLDVEPQPDAPDKKPGEVAIDAKLRKRLEGRYQLTPDFIFDVRDRGGHLMVGITNQETQEVFPDSPTHWSYRGVDATLEFKLPKAGFARSLILHQNGAAQTARRIK